MSAYVWFNDRARSTASKLAGELRSIYAGRPLVGYRLSAVVDSASVLTIVTVACHLRDEPEPQVIDFRMVYEDARGQPVPRSKVGGAWHLVNWVRL